jgi:hypothetical protein
MSLEPTDPKPESLNLRSNDLETLRVAVMEIRSRDQDFNPRTIAFAGGSGHDELQLLAETFPEARIVRIEFSPFKVKWIQTEIYQENGTVLIPLPGDTTSIKVQDGSQDFVIAQSLTRQLDGFSSTTPDQYKYGIQMLSRSASNKGYLLITDPKPWEVPIPNLKQQDVLQWKVDLELCSDLALAYYKVFAAHYRTFAHLPPGLKALQHLKRMPNLYPYTAPDNNQVQGIPIGAVQEFILHFMQVIYDTEVLGLSLDDLLSPDRNELNHRILCFPNAVGDTVPNTSKKYAKTFVSRVNDALSGKGSSIAHVATGTINNINQSEVTALLARHLDIGIPDTAQYRQFIEFVGQMARFRDFVLDNSTSAMYMLFRKSKAKSR